MNATRRRTLAPPNPKLPMYKPQEERRGQPSHFAGAVGYLTEQQLAEWFRLYQQIPIQLPTRRLWTPIA